MRLLILVLLVIQASSGFSQSDSSETDTMEISQPAVPGEQEPKLDEVGLFNDQILIKVPREEVPLFLQRILHDEKYRGWESGGVHRNEQSTLFRVEVRDGMKNMTYFFDKEGSLIGAE
jgi:hypothetical protein